MTDDQQTSDAGGPGTRCHGGACVSLDPAATCGAGCAYEVPDDPTLKEAEPCKAALVTESTHLSSAERDRVAHCRLYLTEDDLFQEVERIVAGRIAAVETLLAEGQVAYTTGHIRAALRWPQSSPYPTVPTTGRCDE